MKLTKVHLQVLRAMAEGHLLKSHRDLEGHKTYQLHPLDGAPSPVDPTVIERLSERGLIDSNKKFPAAIYWLTPEGRRLLRMKPVGIHSVNSAAE
jgi:hypothetical protein